MRLISLLSVIVLFACATPARAQDPAPAANPITACLATAPPEGRNACIGLVGEPCMDEPQAVSTVGMIECFAREADMWRGEVTRLTARLRSQESPTQVAGFNAMLDANESWMEARCAYSGLIFENGSLARVMAAACVRNTTAELTLDLLDRLDQH